MNIENQILDLYDDVYLETTLSKIASEIPEKFKNTKLLSFEDRNNYKDDDFALCIKTKTGGYLRKFPIKTDIDTLISSKYLELNCHKLDESALKIAAFNIKTACIKFNLEYSDFYSNPDFDFNKAKIFDNYYQEKMTKKANFFENIKLHNNNVKNQFNALENRYSLKNLECVKKAEAYFDKYASEFTPTERHKYSLNVIKRASDFGYDITSNQIRRYAGIQGFNTNLVSNLNYRSSLTSSSNCQKKYLDLIPKIGSIQPIQFAEELGNIDSISGLNKLYGTAIHDNYSTTFATEKIADTNKNIDYNSIFNASKKEKLINYFGSDFVKNFETHQNQFFDSLSEEVKEIINLIDTGRI